MARSSCQGPHQLWRMNSPCFWIAVAWFTVSALAIGSDALGDVSGGAKLNLPRALLPLGVQPPPLDLHVSGAAGCYAWSSSRDDVVNISIIESSPGCSTAVRLSGYPQLAQRQTAIIFAEDVYTKQILRCDVIIDKIAILDIVTTTREFFVEEAPEAFEVRAYDDQGNEFTTLDGVEFTWTVVSSLQNSDVIRIITFSESNYEASEALKELEARGIRGHTVLLEGVSTGTAKITVKLMQPEYSFVKSAEVTLRVVANLLIFPSDASIMQKDTVKFKIIQVREGRLIEVPQPSTQYWLEIVDSSIAILDKESGLTTGKELGTTKILLRDAGEGVNDDNEMLRPPEANLRVVTPYALQLELRPMPTSRAWSVQCESDVNIIVHILDNHSRRIYVGSETRVSVTLDESMLEVKWCSANGTFLNGTARKAGVVKITATLLSVAGKPVKSKITTNGEIRIFNKIKIIPPVSILPWDSVYERKSEVELKAVGGDGVYVWRGEGAATVDPRGLVTAQEIGNATIVASMPSNSYIFGTASVIVADPLNMNVVWYEEEGPVGSNLAIHVALFTQLYKSDAFVPFTNCDLMPFNVISLEGISFELLDLKHLEDESLRDTACTILNVQCKEAGSGLVKIKLGKLSMNLSLRCYAPLERLYPSPSHASIVLAVGSSLNSVFIGGPVSWYDQDTDHQQINVLSSKTANVVPYHLPVENSLHVYTITCLEIGETKASIKMFGNADSNTAVSKAVEATLHIHCSQPHSVKMILKNELSTLCPSLSSQLMVTDRINSMEVEVAVFNANGLQFHNATSLRVRLLGKPTGILPNLSVEKLMTRLDQQYSVPVVDYHYEELKINSKELFNKNGLGEINLEITGYRESVLKTAKVVRVPNLLTQPRATLPLILITPVQTIDKVIVFNYPSSVVKVPLMNGSGHFQISVSNGGHAHILLDGTGRSLKIQPFSDGDITVTINDLCVTSPSAVLQVSIVSIANIIADIPELIEKGKNVPCIVYFYDRAGYVIPAHLEGAPSLISRVTEGHVNVSPNNVQKGKSDGVLYTVTGLDVGDANIEFTAGLIQGLVHTYVFPPLKLVPQMSIILPGGNVKIGVVGGPPSPAVIRFKRNTAASDVIDIGNTGVVRGLGIGLAQVEAYADGFKGAESIQAFAKVQVMQLEGITIHAPTTTLLTGNAMPLWAMGIPDLLTPIELGSLKPALHFRWSVSGDGLVSITDTLGLTGIEFDDVDRVAVHLTALKSGNVVVHLNVTTVPGSVMARICGYSWYTKYEFTVVEPLRLIKPAVDNTQLLLPTHSSLTLETNYQSSKLTYSLVENLSKSLDGPIAKISSDGKLETFGRLGFGMILVNVADSPSSPKQHISFTFEVCTPHYSMMELEKESGWNRLAGLSALPSGLMLPLRLSKYDIVGRKFEAPTHNVLQNTNRPDLILSTANLTKTIKVVLSDSGQAVMKLWDVTSEKQFSDYLSVKIVSAIYPQNIQATVGDIWCMRSAIKGSKWTENSAGAIWTSLTGMTQARISQVAATSLTLKPPQGLPFTTQAAVVTRPADLILFLDTENEHVVTDEKPYTAHLVLANHEEQNKINNLLFGEKTCLTEDLDYYPFTCEIRHPENVLSSSISVVPVFNKNRGVYGCQLSWTPDSTAPVSVNNTRSLSVVARTVSSTSDPLYVRCIHAAKVKPENVVLSPPPAQLTPIDVIASSEVLKQLKVVSESEVLSVEGPLHLSDVSVRYIIRGNNQAAGIQKANVRLESPLTNQNDEIIVVLNDGIGLGGTCVSGGGSSVLQFIEKYQFFFMSIITMVSLLAATVYVYGNFILPLRASRIAQPFNVTQTNDASFRLRNMTNQSRSPLSRHDVSPSQHDLSAILNQSSNAALDTSGSAVYGDPSFLASMERRRNRRFL